ncbi:MAG TPA: ABC transporter ATP-binding protein [Gemmatimonadales bacterium]|nr:ABC transporter ATP-binding protein [Gemmatimonadales bacterium]
MLVARLADQRGELALDVELSAPAGSTTVLVGESGAGKTSILRALAGLDRPARGRVSVDGCDWLDTERSLALPPWRRAVGYVPQDYALFPHLTVEQNVSFGLDAGTLGAAQRRHRVHESLAIAGVPGLGARLPHQCSGGEQQRVALARALAPAPRLLLLDEPLAALDLHTRRTVRTELRDLLGRLPCISLYVTHSPLEALVFGDQIVVLERGQVTQKGARDELLRHPRSPFVAELMGTNLFIGQRDAPAGTSGQRVRTAEGEIAVSSYPAPGNVFLTVSPREITLFHERPGGSAQNVFRGPIMEVVPEPPGGERVRVVLGTTPVLVAEVTREAVDALRLRAGVEVYATFKATGVSLYS